MKLRLLAMDPQSRREASERICRSIRDTPAWANATRVCAFLPMPSEPQIQSLWGPAATRSFCFPRVCGDALELIRIADPARLAGADWQLADFADAPIVAPESVELFLVPGLAFTRDGRRLGRGRGHYDRLLARLPRIARIGVCFACQLVDELPTDPHDQSVDEVAAG